MAPRRRFLLTCLLILGVAAPAAQARLGETLADLKKRFGAPAPQLQPRKDNAAWLFEGDDGQLMYTVTFNAKGQSIAEGLKPLKRARFNRQIAMDFIDGQIAPARESPTLHVVEAGGTYTFAGRNYTCGAKEYVVVDDRLGLLVIWTQEGVPAVLVVAPEMMRR